MTKDEVRAFFDRMAPQRDAWIQRNRIYHDELSQACRFVIPAGSSVLQLGCGTGNLLASLEPGRGVGIDLSPEMVRVAKNRHPHLEFRTGDAEKLDLDEKFDFVVLCDLVGHLSDVQTCFEGLTRVTTPDSRLIVSSYNFVWEPVLRLAENLGFKMQQPPQNWLGMGDLQNLLELADFQIVRSLYRLLCPVRVPVLAPLLNQIISQLPGFKHLTAINLMVARRQRRLAHRDARVSVVIPARNERGNIAAAIERTPQMGSGTEIIFVEGNSSDGTADEIRKQIAAHPDKKLQLIDQGSGRGKGDAVRKGFAAATGDFLMILDADLTVPPEELPKFFEALACGRGDFVNGTRLVYPMEDQAMRFLNLLGNKFFAMCFSWLLDQRLKDTLCGTKVLRRKDYERIAANRHYFGDFDPFGDFDLLFGAAKQNLKIVEVPIRYKARTYGETNISRFRHGWLLLKMCVFAYTKLKIARGQPR
jgi:SAM-dependent methyltransferase